MSGFYSRSSSRRRYPDPNMGGKHYKKKGLFGMFPGFGSFSGSGSSGRYGGYPNQGYPGAGYSGQNYPNQGRQGQTQAGYQQHRSDGQASFQPNTPTASGQIICPKCGTAVPTGSKFCRSAVRKCRLVRRYALNAANCCRRGRSSAWSAELRFGAEPGKRDEKSRRLHRGVLYRKRTLRCLFSCA